MTTPRKQQTNNLRQRFRIPVLRNSGLIASIRMVDHPLLHVHVSDVTELGIQLHFAAKERSGLVVGTNVDFEAQFRGESINLKGEISRLLDDHLVIVLATPTDDQQRQQVERWRGITLVLQQLWLKSRLR